MESSETSAENAASNEGVDSNMSVAPVRTANLAGDLTNVIRGFCMGAADTVPGVSGGTIALILGHYQRLVTAISKVDKRLFQLASSRQFSEAANHIDLRFLIALGIGVVTGIVTLAGLMHELLDHHTFKTFAVFFGLILASVWIVKGYIKQWTIGRGVACVIGIIAAAAISFLPTASESLSLPYLFFAASIAICAMILPGISGAFVLLLFGIYHPITGLIKNAVKGEITAEGLIQIVTFASGCLFGLLAFSRLLRWLLEHYKDTTMALLMGLMIGSIAKLWPLQSATSDTAGLEFKLREFQYVSPAHFDGSVLLLVALTVASAAIVLIAEWIASRGASEEG